ESEPAFPRTLCQSGNASVESVTAAVEDAGLDARLLRALRQRLADLLGLLHRPERAELRLGPAGRRNGATGRVVDELGEDALVRAEDGHARTLGGAAHLGAHTPAALEPLGGLRRDAHARLPT